jgi:hypothetical protein
VHVVITGSDKASVVVITDNTTQEAAIVPPLDVRISVLGIGQDAELAKLEEITTNVKNIIQINGYNDLTYSLPALVLLACPHRSKS